MNSVSNGQTSSMQLNFIFENLTKSPRQKISNIRITKSVVHHKWYRDPRKWQRALQTHLQVIDIIENELVLSKFNFQSSLPIPTNLSFSLRCCFCWANRFWRSDGTAHLPVMPFGCFVAGLVQCYHMVLNASISFVNFFTVFEWTFVWRFCGFQLIKECVKVKIYNHGSNLLFSNKSTTKICKNVKIPDNRKQN